MHSPSITYSRRAAAPAPPADPIHTAPESTTALALTPSCASCARTAIAVETAPWLEATMGCSNGGRPTAATARPPRSPARKCLNVP